MASEVGRGRRWLVKGFALILGLFMCFWGCIAFWQAFQSTLSLIARGRHVPALIAEYTVFGAAFLAFGCGLIVLAVRDREKT